MKMAPSLHPNITNFLMDALEREKERAREVIVIENKTTTIKLIKTPEGFQIGD